MWGIGVDEHGGIEYIRNVRDRGLTTRMDDGCERNTGGIVLDDDETDLHCRREGGSPPAT